MENFVPCNTKSLLAFTFAQMGKLDRDEIDSTKACAMAKLISQANNLLNYELKRAVVMARLQESNPSLPAPEIRQIESKGFDS